LGFAFRGAGGVFSIRLITSSRSVAVSSVLRGLDMGRLSESLSKAYDEMMAFYEELNGGSARGAAILAVASLDAELEEFIIQKCFPSDLPEARRRQAFDNGPLQSFWAKIQIGQALGLYGDETRKAMGWMGEVRNRFAHRSKISFHDEYIMERCEKLGFKKAVPNPSDADIRSFFIHRVRDLHALIEWHRRYFPALDLQVPPPLD